MLCHNIIFILNYPMKITQKFSYCNSSTTNE